MITVVRTHLAVGFAFVVVAVAMAVYACTDPNEDLPFAPSDCDTQEPSVGPYEVVVSFSAQFPSIPITIYTGAIEDNDIFTVDTLTQTSAVYVVLTDTEYATVAIYVVGLDTVAVLDAARVDAVSTEYRDATCWDVFQGTADLRLRVGP